jgi:hypothetical protein
MLVFCVAIPRELSSLIPEQPITPHNLVDAVESAKPQLWLIFAKVSTWLVPLAGRRASSLPSSIS